MATNNDEYAIKKMCWAQSEKCAGDLTKEHVVSEGVLKSIGPLKTTKNGKEYKLGTGSYVVRSLCDFHNSRLSPFDTEAKNFFQGTHALAHNKTHPLIETTDFGQKILRINGKRLERWFAKTIVNTAIFEAQAFKAEKPPFDLSARNVYEKLFEGDEFIRPFGLRLAKHGVKLNPNLRPGIHTGTTYQDINLNRAGKGWTEHSSPVFYYVACHMIELVGFFNLTDQADDFALQSFLKPYVEYVEEKTSPLPFKAGFSLPGETGFGEHGPARVVDFTKE